jgi:hypothetical protein
MPDEVIPEVGGIVIGRLQRLIITGLSVGAGVTTIVKDSGSDEPTINELITALKGSGFITEEGKLSEKGLSLLRAISTGTPA